MRTFAPLVLVLSAAGAAVFALTACAPTRVPRAEPQWKIAPVYVETLTFMGGSAVARDDMYVKVETGQPLAYPLPVLYSAPQWSNREGRRCSYPYAYVRNTTLAVQVGFRIADKTFDPAKQIALVRGIPRRDGRALLGSSEKPVGLPATRARYDPGADRMTASFESPVAFADKVDYIPELEIEWQCSVDKGRTWTPVGRSANTIYVTYRKPSAALFGKITDRRGKEHDVSLFLRTAVEYGCKAAAGKNDAKEALDCIWEYNFSRRNARRADRQRLHYYKSWLVPSPTGYMQELVYTLDGQCGTWAALFVAALQSQGLIDENGCLKGTRSTIREAVIRPKGLVTNEQEFILVKNWQFSKDGHSSDKDYPYVNYLGAATKLPAPLDKVQAHVSTMQKLPRIVEKNGTWRYDWDAPNPPDVTDEAGVPGQNVPDPPSTFPNHGLVVRQNAIARNICIYDPSYGKVYESKGGTLDDALLDFQRQCVSGFYVVREVPSPRDKDKTTRAMLIRKPREALELIFLFIDAKNRNFPR